MVYRRYRDLARHSIKSSSNMAHARNGRQRKRIAIETVIIGKYLPLLNDQLLVFNHIKMVGDSIRGMRHVLYIYCCGGCYLNA